MQEELYIEGKRVDLMPNKVTRNLQIGKLGDVADRESSYSNTVKLPMTARNIEIFEFLGVTGNVSRYQYKKLHCRYIVDGIPLINSGFCVVQSLSEAYEVVLYDGIIDLGEALQDKKITDLNYNDINHYISPSNFFNNMNNTEGYIYALGDFGVPRNSDGSFQSERIAPSLFVSDLWNRIFTQNGFQYTGRFFDENEHFLTEVIPPGKGYDMIDEEFEAIELGQATTGDISHYETSSTALTHEVQHEFITTDVDETTYDAETKELVFNFDGLVNISALATNKLFEVNYSLQAWALYKLNGETIIEQEIFTYIVGARKEFTIRVLPGDRLSLWVKAIDTYPYEAKPYYTNRPYDDRYLYTINYKASVELDFTKTSGGVLTKFEEILPELGQLEFIKDVVQRYGLLIRPIKNSNTYEFIQFEELLNDKTNAEDWSEYYVNTQEEKYDASYGRKNEATYKYSNDIEVPTHDGNISVDVETLQQKSTMFSSPYTISNSNKTFYGLPYYQVPIWEYDPDGEDEDGNKVTTIENIEAEPRIFRVARTFNDVSLKYFDRDPVEVGRIIPVLSLDNLSMQFFLNNYYKAFRGVIETYKEVHMDVFVTEMDVYNLNFFRLKYLKQYGKYYYLNKLKYSVGEVASGVFIELNTYSSNEKPTALADIVVEVTKNMRKAIPLESFYTGYVDLEFDKIKAVKITSGFSHQDITLRSNRRTIITTETVIPVINGTIALDVVERSLTLIPDSTVFTYQVMDEGSLKWSDAEGTITVNVAPYVNEAPDIHYILSSASMYIDPEFADLDPPVYYRFFILYAEATDETGNIVSYNWEILEKPETSDVYLYEGDNKRARAILSNDNTSIGTYRFRVTVCDSWGVCSTRDTDEFLVTA